MDVLSLLLVGGIGFGRHFLGIILRPYETYRRIVERGSVFELVYIGALLALYFGIASLVKAAAFRPLLLTKHFLLLSVAVVVTFCITVGLLWGIATLVGGRGRLTGFAVAWGYTLIPTLVWFLATSLLFVFLPPPRTTSALGIAFSFLYLVFSGTLFFWKATLAYLTLRFGMRLDLGKILLVAAVIAPLMGAYSVAMYRLGIFKVPFL